MLTRALIGGCVLALAAPGVAHAVATAARDGVTVTVTGTDGAEAVTALKDGATLALTGDVAAGPGCSLSGSEVRCGTGVTRVRMDLGGGDDSGAGRRLLVLCLFGSCPPPRAPLDVPLELDAGPGDDSLIGGDGDDTLRGGPGRDTFRLSPFGAADGADVVSGGDGIDEADYSLASPRVVVSLDDLPGDGVGDEGDDVRSDVEDVTGSSGDDRLTGDADANQLAGGAGSDELTGNGGFDALYGEDGVDLLHARDGNPERVDCGADNDFAELDAFDRVSGCENLDVSAALQADLDHDGVAAPADCDDTDPAVHPGAADAPDNGLDENCDGADATIADRDHDGLNAPADCDDANAAIHPGAAEVVGNAVDENCDGSAESAADDRVDRPERVPGVAHLDEGAPAARDASARRHDDPRGVPRVVQAAGVPAGRDGRQRRARHEAAGPAQAARARPPPSAGEEPDRPLAAALGFARPARRVHVPRAPDAEDQRTLRAAGRHPGQPVPGDRSSVNATSGSRSTSARRAGSLPSYSVSASAHSTSLPRYITPIRSHMCRTTARSCAMNTIVSSRSRCSCRSRLSTWAWIETSAAETGSSAITRRGRSASARAMPIRRRWPPENCAGRRL